MEILASEQKAADLVNRIGLARANRILDAIIRRFNRRYQKACDAGGVPVNPEWIRRTPLERELEYQLKIGTSLVDDYFTPEAARARILARIAQRKAQQKAKRAASA